LFSSPLPDISQAKFSLASLESDKFDWKAALATAMASELAYWVGDSVREKALSWGFDKCKFIDINRTQCFVATSSKVVLVAFRGTQQTHDWLTNLHMRSRVHPPIGRVHSGFYDGFQDVQTEVERAMGNPGNRALVITGHSLGGALSTIAAAIWADSLPVTSIYTFGQPAVGKRSFVKFIEDNYSDQFFRFVNDDDIVPRVPPTFRHVGRLFHFDRSGDLKGGRHESMASFGAESESDAVLTQEQFEVLQEELRRSKAIDHRGAAQEGLIPSVSDHSMVRYVGKIMKFQ
jgi:hypothetical protein